MADIQTKGIILRRADYRDYDRMVTIFSPELGKIDAIARGSRKQKSQLMNATEPFTAGEFQLFRKGERYTLEQCRITESFFDLRLDYDRLKHGVYWLKLLETSVMSDVPMPELFLVTMRALAYLSYSDLQPELLTMAFEMHLMARLGLSPNVETCSGCGCSIGGDVKFDVFNGNCTCSECNGIGKTVSDGARRVIRKLPRTDFDKVEMLVDYPYWQEAARVFRMYIDDRMQLREFAPPVPQLPK